MLDGMSRTQLAVYAAIGVVLVLLGIRAVRERPPPARPRHRRVTRPGSPPSPSAAAAHRPPTATSSSTSPARSRSPGVYRLPAGSRVADAIERAGGASGRADPNAINLAARLADGQQVVVPVRRARRRPRPPGRRRRPRRRAGPISLGSADQADLETIDGIGPVTAADIIDFRDEHGGVSSIEELDEIPGIGPATIESLSDRLQP